MGTRASRFGLGVCFFAFLIACLPAAAQKITGDIAGTVSDSSGAAVPDATVTAENAGTAAVRTVTTSNTGAYRIADLPVGTYKLSVSATGFKTARSTVEVSSGSLTT